MDRTFLTRGRGDKFIQNLTRKCRKNNVMETRALMFKLAPLHDNVILSGGRDPSSLNYGTIRQMYRASWPTAKNPGNDQTADWFGRINCFGVAGKRSIYAPGRNRKLIQQ
jgi:hypothetical protein